jgi:dTDP-4-amino-4,6-dideoxygalactose transaminase
VIPFFDLAATTSEVRAEVTAAWEGLIDSGAFVGGTSVQDFEAQWADFCGTREAVGVANGTDALHLAMRAMGIGPGHDVVVPANTFVATVEAVVLAGARPAFADVDPDTLLMTAETLKSAVTPNTRAVILVHLYGQMPRMGELLQTADDLDLAVIEDAAQAHGATWEGAPAGSFGRVGCFSFYPSKNLGAFGDAGAVVTSDSEIADEMRRLRDHGRVQGGHYEHASFGTNSRLDSVQAVVLSAKLRRLSGWNEARRALARRYREGLDPEVVRLVAEEEGSAGVYHLAVARVRNRDRVRDELRARGVATSIHYPMPCHLIAPYADSTLSPLPAAEMASTEILSLPMYPHLTAADVDFVCSQINQVARGESRP